MLRAQRRSDAKEDRRPVRSVRRWSPDSGERIFFFLGGNESCREGIASVWTAVLDENEFNGAAARLDRPRVPHTQLRQAISESEHR